MADTPTRGGSRAARTPAGRTTVGRTQAGRTPTGRTPSQQTPTGRINNPDAAVHTPLDRTGPRDLANSVRRGLSASGRRDNNAPTPHAAAARRALEQRRTAMFTPGKNRRQSLREQHQTPMNILNQLARRLAPATQQVVTSSSPADRTSMSVAATPSGMGQIPEDDEDFEVEDPQTAGDYDSDDDGDEEELPPPPRFSLALQEDEDTTELEPPRLSELPEDNQTNYTVGSVELPREQAQSRYSRASVGSVGLGLGAVGEYSDNDQTADMSGRPSDFFPESLLENLRGQAAENAAAIDRFDGDTTILPGRESNFTMGVPADVGDQTTFMLSEPGDGPATSPLPPAATGAQERAGGDTSGNISFIPVDPDLEPPPQFGGDDYSDDDREPEVFDEPMIQEEPEQDPEAGRQRDKPMLDVEAFISDGEDSDPNTTRQDTTMTTSRPAPARRGPKPGKRKQKRISKHGTEYPPLPPSFVRRVAHRAVQTSGLNNHRISADVLASLTQASEWFFEQLGDDLGAYADHAGRTVIEESDVMTLMKRQRQIGSDATVFSLAQRHLPRELLQELRMPMPATINNKRHKSITQYDDDDDDDGSEIS